MCWTLGPFVSVSLLSASVCVSVTFLCCWTFWKVVTLFDSFSTFTLSLLMSVFFSNFSLCFSGCLSFWSIFCFSFSHLSDFLFVFVSEFFSLSLLFIPIRYFLSLYLFISLFPSQILSNSMSPFLLFLSQLFSSIHSCHSLFLSLMSFFFSPLPLPLSLPIYFSLRFSSLLHLRFSSSLICLTLPLCCFLLKSKYLSVLLFSTTLSPYPTPNEQISKHKNFFIEQLLNLLALYIFKMWNYKNHFWTLAFSFLPLLQQTSWSYLVISDFLFLLIVALNNA